MIQKMTRKHAKEIVEWVYPKPYDVYTMKGTFDELMEGYFAIEWNGELVGFFCKGKDAQVPPYQYEDGFMDFGIGMKPEYCGQNKGERFMREVIEYLKVPLRLTVLDWNKRAISLYKKLGFQETDYFIKDSGKFIIMELHGSK